MHRSCDKQTIFWIFLFINFLVNFASDINRESVRSSEGGHVCTMTGVSILRWNGAAPL